MVVSEEFGRVPNHPFEDARHILVTTEVVSEAPQGVAGTWIVLTDEITGQVLRFPLNRAPDLVRQVSKAHTTTVERIREHQQAATAALAEEIAE